MTVQISRLDNGLTVATEHMSHLESAALGIWVDAGSRTETSAEHGISHLLEHMAFKGTARRSASQIAEAIEAVGGEVNAATSTETTSYYARILKDDVPLAIDILSDILQDPKLDPHELRREQHVICQEIGATLDTPDDQVFDLFQAAAFPGQAIGRPILGTPDTVNAFTRDDIGRFLTETYRPGGMILAAAGAVDHASVVELARSRFGTMSARPARPLEAAVYTGGETIEQRDLQEAQVLLGFPGCAYLDDDYYAAQILSSILGGGMASRLFQEVRERRGLCYSIYAFHWAFSDSGLFGIHAATAREDLEELMPVILGEILRLIEGVETAELARVKAQLRAGLLMTLESPMARAGQFARQIAIHGRALEMEELVDHIDAVDRGDLARLAERCFLGAAPTVAAVGPVGELMRRDDIAHQLSQARPQAAE